MPGDMGGFPTSASTTPAAMTLLGTVTVTGTAATTLSMVGLDLSAARHFVLEISLKNATASGANISCYYNGDTTAANYHEQLLTGYAGGASAARTNDAIMMSLTGSGFADATGNIWNAQDGKPVAAFIVAPREGAAISNIFIRHWAHMWNFANNVTTITLSSSVANSLAPGSYFRVWSQN